MDFCNNCGKYGHLFKNCSDAITSIGIICFKLFPNNDIKYLTVMRRHTYAYVEIVRTKRYLSNEYLEMLCKNITKKERLYILNHDFDFIWNELWTVKNTGIYIKDYKTSRDGYNKRIDFIKEYLKHNDPEYTEPEWGFPKGRRNFKEDNKSCAIREFNEETKLTSADYQLIKLDNKEEFNEEFLAENNIRYKFIYYIAIMKTEKEPYIDIFDNNQVGEIGRIEWKSFDELMNRKTNIVDNNKEKYKIIKLINDLIIKKYNFTELLNVKIGI